MQPNYNDTPLSDDSIVVSQEQDKRRKKLKQNFPKVKDEIIDQVVRQDFEDEPLPPKYNVLEETTNPDGSVTTVTKLPVVNVQVPDIATSKYFEYSTEELPVAPQRPEGTTVSKWDNFKTFDPFKLNDIVRKDNEKETLKASLTALGKNHKDYGAVKQRLDDIEHDEVKADILYKKVWADELFKANLDIINKLGYVPIPDEMKKSPTMLDELMGLPRGFNRMMGSTLQGLSIMMQEVNKLLPGLGGPIGYGEKYEDNLGFRIGSWLIDANTPDLRDRKQNLQEHIMNGLGSALGFIVLGRTLGGGNQTEIGTRLISMLTGGTSQFSDEYLEALKSDHKENAWKVAAYNFLLGTTEGLPLEKYLNGFGNFGSKSWKEYFKQIAIQGSEEFGQETLQQFGTNLTAKELYDNSRNLVDGVLEGGIVGFLSGALLQGAVGTMNKLAQIKQDKETAKYQKLLEDLSIQSLSQSFSNGMTKLNDFIQRDPELSRSINFKKDEVVPNEPTDATEPEQLQELPQFNETVVTEGILNSLVAKNIIKETFGISHLTKHEEINKAVAYKLQGNQQEFENAFANFEISKDADILSSDNIKEIYNTLNAIKPLNKEFVYSQSKNNQTTNQTFGSVLSEANIQANEAPVQHIYNSLLNTDKFFSADNEVVKHVISKTLNVPVKILSGSEISNLSGSVKTNGAYLNGVIYINKDANLSKINNPTSTLIHEAIHHLTYERIKNDPVYEARIKNIIGLVKDKWGEFDNSSWLKELEKPYEFIAYVLESDDFKADLETIPLYERETIIDKIIGFIKDVIGIQSPNAYGELKQILFDAGDVSTSNMYKGVVDEIAKSNSRDSEETINKDTEPSERVVEGVDTNKTSGEEERKIVQLLEEERPSQSSGTLIKHLLTENGDRIYSTVRQAWDDVQGLMSTSKDTQEAFERFEQLLESKGMNFDSEFLTGLNDELIAETGHSYTEHLFHSLMSMSDQRLATIDSNGNVVLIGKDTPTTSWVDEEGVTKYTLRTKRMYEELELELQNSGFDVKIYEVVQFKNLAKDGTATIKNSFKDTFFRNKTYIDMEKFEGKELKMQAYKNTLLKNGFVVIPTTKSHILIDIRNLKINGENFGLDLSNYPAHKIWKEALFPQNNKLLLAVMAEMPDSIRKYVEPFRNRNLFFKDKQGNRRDGDTINQLNNIVYGLTYSYVFDKFVRSILPGFTSDKQVFKRLDNLGGDGHTSIVLGKHKTGVRTQKEGSYMWTEGDDIFIRSAIIDGSTIPNEWKSELGQKFDLADGCAFILPQVRAKYNEINLQSVKQGVALKYKLFVIGELHKKAAHVITPETHPKLWKFMLDNRIAELNMDTAVKIKKNFLEAGKQLLDWSDIQKGTIVDERYSTVRAINKDAHMFNKNHTDNTAKGALPTYVRTGMVSFFNQEARERILKHFLGDVDKMGMWLNTMKDDNTRLNALKKLADNNEKQGYTHNILQFLKTLDESNAAITKMDIFADVFFDGVVKSKLQNTLNHEQNGSTPVLTPDVGNYKQYLLRSGQITKDQVDTYFTENGFLRDNYIIVDYTTYEKHGYKNNNKTFIFVNPPSGFQDGRAVEVIGYLPKSMGANAVVAPNSQLQVISGKDYDIDVAILIPTLTDNQKQMWNDLKELNVDDLYKKYMYNGTKSETGFADIKPFVNARLAQKLTLESNPGLEQAIIEKGLTIEEGLKDSELMEGKIVIDPEDAHVIEDRDGNRIFDLNPDFSDLSFKDIVKFNKFQAKLEDTDIGRLYNIAVFYSEFLQTSDGKAEFTYTIKDKLPKEWIKNGSPDTEIWNRERKTIFSIDKSKVPFDLILLNRLTHLVLDWMNNLKLFQFKYSPDRLIEHLFTIDGDIDIFELSGNQSQVAFAFKSIAESVMMPPRKLLKFREQDGKNTTFGGIMKVVNQAATQNTPFDMTLINQSPVRVNELKFNGLRLSSAEQTRVNAYVKSQILEGDPKPHWDSTIRNFAGALHVINELAKASNPNTGNGTADRMFRLRDASNYIGSGFYEDYVFKMLLGNHYVISNAREQIGDNKNKELNFEVGARKYIFLNAKNEEGQYTGQLKIKVQDLNKVGGAVISEQVFDSFASMFYENGKPTLSYQARLKDFKSILHKNATPAVMFSDFFKLDNETARAFTRKFLKDTYIKFLNTPNFYTASRLKQESFFYGTLGYYGRDFTLESIKILAQYNDKGEKEKAVSYADAIMFMIESGNEVGKQVAERWIGLASTAINSAEPVLSSQRPSFEVITTESQRKQLVNDIIKDFDNVIDEEQVVRLWNANHPDKRIEVTGQKEKGSEQLEAAKEYWVDNIITAFTELDMFTKDKGFKWVKGQVYKHFRKMMSADGNNFHNPVSKVWAKAIPFNRLIRFFGKRNRLFANNESALVYYLGGSRRSIKANDIAREFDMVYAVGTPIRLSGPMIDWYQRLQTHYHYANLMRNFEELANLPVSIMSSDFVGLLPNEAGIESTKIQAEIYDISEGRDERKILHPDNFKVDKVTGDIVLTYNGQSVSLSLFSFPDTLTESMRNVGSKERVLKKTFLNQTELKKAIDIIFQYNPNAQQKYVSPDNEYNAFLQSTLKRQVMAAIINRYMYDFYTPKALELQIDDYKGLYNLLLELPDTDPARQKSLGLMREYVRRLQEMLKQTESMSSKLELEGMYYMPRTFNDEEQMLKEFVKIKSKEYILNGLNEKDAKKKARKDFKTAIKQNIKENHYHRGYLSPIHNSYFTREHLLLDSGYMKDSQVAANYMTQLNSLLRYQMLSLYEAYNSRLTRDESAFTQHELKFMSAVTRSDGHFYKAINPAKVSKNQSIQFQFANRTEPKGRVIDVKEFGKYDTGYLITIEGKYGKTFTLDSRKIQEARSGNAAIRYSEMLGKEVEFVYKSPDMIVNIVGDVAYNDGQNVGIITPSGELKVYPIKGMLNTELMRGVRLARKIGINGKRLTGMEGTMLDEFTVWVAKKKLSASNISMLGGKPFYALRNVIGGTLNSISYVGYSSYRATLSEYKSYVKDWQAFSQNSSTLPENKKILYSILTEYSSIILGDMDKVMGRFGGVVQMSESALSPETIRVWNQRRHKWKAKSESLKGLEQTLKSNPNDVGLSTKYFAATLEAAMQFYNDKGFYNIPFGLFEIGRESAVVNPVIGEVYLRDRIAISVATSLMKELEIDNPNAPKEAIQEFISRFILTNVTHAINTTQFQYIPGFFLSHFDSTITGKAWFTQFSHYSNSLQFAYFGRIENMFRQMKQFGFLKTTKASIIDLMPFTGAKKLKYKAYLNDNTELTVTEYLELSRAIRMTSAALLSSMIGAASKSMRILFKSFVSYGVLVEIIDLIFTKNFGEAVNIPIIQGMINWALFGLSQLVWSVPDDNDDSWEKRVKRAFAETFGETEDEYVARNLQQMSKGKPGRDYTYGNYGDVYDYNRQKGIDDKTIENQWFRETFNDLVWVFVPSGVGLTQIQNMLLSLYITGYAPDDIREQSLQYMQTQVPFSWAGMQFIKNINEFDKVVAIGNNPVQTRRNELQNLKENTPDKAVLGGIVGFKTDKDYLESKLKENPDLNQEMNDLNEEFEQDLRSESDALKQQIKKGTLTKEQAQKEFTDFAEEQYRKKYSPIILPSKKQKIINELKEELNFKQKEED